MKIFKRQNSIPGVALCAGAVALMALAPQTHAQSAVDDLLKKLEQKGILTSTEARELKAENEQETAAEFKQAMNARFPMPDWVTNYKLYGSFRGLYDDRCSLWCK
ncbi:MAG: hypothetical protein KGJ60_13165 [Verrucomicrobiota bacterium]|nr:hypothetical protein [Verrucomicrobiota bacterium]